jgi:hypothetical protein
MDEEFETRRHKGTKNHRENYVKFRVTVTPYFKKANEL